MEYAVGVLSAFPDFADELRTELDGQASIFTIGPARCVIWIISDDFQ